MIGFMVIGFFILYLLISILVVIGVISWAKNNDRSAWKWGWLAAFIMYNLMFWDFIPTLVVHRYYCATEAGFWVYKSPEKWRQENIDVVDILTRQEPAEEYKIESISNGVSTTYAVDQRIRVLNRVTNVTPILETRRKEALLIDSKNNLILTRKVSFEAGRPFSAPKSILDFKFWVNAKECNGKVGNSTPIVWGKAESSYKNMGEKK